MSMKNDAASMPSSKHRWLANSVGAIALLGAASGVGLFFESSVVASLIVWALLGIFASYLWEHSGVRGTRNWLIVAVIGVGATALSFALDCIVGKLLHPEMSWLDAGTRSLGFFVTLIAGGVSACALAGALRDWVLLVTCRHD